MVKPSSTPNKESKKPSLRKIFLISLGGADELASYALGISTVWALSFALLHRAHIRVDAVYILLPRRYGVGLDILALFTVLVFSVLLSWHAYAVFATSLRIGANANTPMGTPLWLPQGLWAAGLIFFAFCTALVFLRAVFCLANGRLSEIAAFAGTRSVDEELEEEITHVQDAGHLHIQHPDKLIGKEI